MWVELSPEQRDYLLRLVDAEIRELGPEIHHTRTYKDELKEQRRELWQLRDRLAAVVPEQTPRANPTESSHLVGTA